MLSSAALADEQMEYRFSTDWFSAYVPLWLQAMKTVGLDPKKPLKILEIGSFEGRSACWISDNLLDHPDSSLLCIDTFCGSEEYGSMMKTIFEHAAVALKNRFLDNISLSKNSHKVRLIQKDSREILPELCQLYNDFDICYIDGGHHEETAFIDGENCYCLTRPGGLMIFDDVQWGEHWGYPVLKATNRLQDEFKHLELIVDDWQRIYKR